MKRKIGLFYTILMLTCSMFANTSLIGNYIETIKAVSELSDGDKISLDRDIAFFFLSDSINSHIIEYESSDFKVIKQNTILPKNKLMTLIAEYDGGKRGVLLGESNQLVVVDYNELHSKSLRFGFNNSSLLSLIDLTKEEILLSYFINEPFCEKTILREKDVLDLTSYIYQQINQPTDVKFYSILTKHFYENSINHHYSNNVIPAISIKNMCEYQYKRIIEKKSRNNLFTLLKEIALDENIPTKSKTMYTDSLLYLYLENDTEDAAIKEEYFEYVLKVINESPNIKIGEFLTSAISDIKAMQSLFENIKSDRITADELFQISKKILEIDKNPIITLLAYCGIQYYYLHNQDLQKAYQTAIETITKYDTPILWSFYKEPAFFNAKPALMYLDYLMENETDSDILINVIDDFIRLSDAHSEFQNLLIYRKAIVKDFFSYPLDEVVLAYQAVNMEPDNIYAFFQPFQRIYYGYMWKVKRYILPYLQEFKQYTIEMNKPVMVKKNILSSSYDTIALERKTTAIVHSHIPYLLIELRHIDYYKDYTGWVKGEIEGEVFWIYTK